jgi:hypothetical protein
LGLSSLSRGKISLATGGVARLDAGADDDAVAIAVQP